MKFGMPMCLALSFLLGHPTLATQTSYPRPPANAGEIEERNKARARRFYEQIWF